MTTTELAEAQNILELLNTHIEKAVVQVEGVRKRVSRKHQTRLTKAQIGLRKARTALSLLRLDLGEEILEEPRGEIVAFPHWKRRLPKHAPTSRPTPPRTGGAA